ncbi:LacI family DNA-binding transcriptional regulator [Actinomyces israelii]|uniref:LacI family DNA-binding transcriptional regulator n=1 Tax=Actinomyces israelii TaxID=1659 RepID=A0ABT4I4V3_9ACTO|nr:LacI family DNA-binding transcriptional regulator [Actinomyces israelii]MCZ0856749.1 LacI family DNA-binding transcriptional regulator [Actinomyces israelii]
MKPTPKRPTIADVANEAGVSTVTVSRVLSRSQKVSDKTRARVEAVMRELGYFGNSAARQLVSGRPETLAIITSETLPYGYAQTISGAEQRARRAGMSSLICVLDRDDEKAVEHAVASTASHQPAGVVVVDYDALAHSAISRIPDYLPVVDVGPPQSGESSGKPYVAIDEYGGAYEVTKHLVELGHTSVFVVAQPNNAPPERRSVGALDALRDARLPLYPIVRCESWEPRSGYRACRRLLEEYGELVTAVVCPNDELALGAVRAVHEAGLSVPEDVSVTGFDGIPLADVVTPTLTTLRQDFTAAGRAAVELLLDLPDRAGAAPSPVVIASELIRGESTTVPHPRRGLVRAARA